MRRITAGSTVLGLVLHLGACSVIKPPKRPDVLTFVLDAPLTSNAENVAHGDSNPGESRVL
ncbi:MAG TPA: hypothetical protein VFR10_11120, partial [bacterium]|nr:hypothetical protein [bacterium]